MILSVQTSLIAYIIARILHQWITKGQPLDLHCIKQYGWAMTFENPDFSFSLSVCGYNVPVLSSQTQRSVWTTPDALIIFLLKQISGEAAAQYSLSPSFRLRCNLKLIQFLGVLTLP